MVIGRWWDGRSTRRPKGLAALLISALLLAEQGFLISAAAGEAVKVVDPGLRFNLHVAPAAIPTLPTGAGADGTAVFQSGSDAAISQDATLTPLTPVAPNAALVPADDPVVALQDEAAEQASLESGAAPALDKAADEVAAAGSQEASSGLRRVVRAALERLLPSSRAADLAPAAVAEGALAGRSAQGPALSAPAPGDHGPKPIFAMAPLKEITDWGLFAKQLSVLKENGVTGITTDIWWGKFQRGGENQFDWSYYAKYAQSVRDAGLKWQPILSFHSCGGNVGDDCDEPLPAWLKKDSDQETSFVDEKGFVNKEYLAFWHQEAYGHYQAAMASFAKSFSTYADIIPKIYVSLGPAGELRYPSYVFAAGWKYPQRGRLQAYSQAARRDFRDFARKKYGGDLARLNAAWGTSLQSFDEVGPPKYGDQFFRRDAKTPYGRDFLGWYQGVLERHLERMMALAHQELGPAFGSAIGGKLAGVHWLYNDPDMPHAAENSAGYVDYNALLAAFRKARAVATFTALEMDNNQSHTAPTYSAPQTLAKEVAAAARASGVALFGENALPMGSDAQYRRVGYMLSSEGFAGFTLLRMSSVVDDQGNPTGAMEHFKRYVVSPDPIRAPAVATLRRDGTQRLLRARLRQRDSVDARLLGVIALALVSAAAFPLAIGHYGLIAAVSGWAANLTFLFFPWIQIHENLRNMRTLKKGGEAAEKASERLGGVSAGAQTALIAGNLLNFPSFLGSGNPVLIANALMGAAGSLVILGQLSWAERFSRLKMLALSAASAVGVALAFLAHAPLLGLLGIGATAVFSYFTVPQILQNRRQLAIVQRASEPAAVQAALENLKGIKPLYLLVGLAGNLMLVPVFMVSGRWFNVVGVIVGICGPLLVLRQLAQAGLYPKRNVALLALGAAAFFALMAGSSMLVPTGLWR